MIIVGKQPDI